jgi:hypothetical protein
MGEMADYNIEQGLDQGWSPVGGYYRRGRSQPLKIAMCNTCKSAAVQWRKNEENKWRLYDAAWLHPRRKTPVLHACPPTNAPNADGFEVEG